MQGSTAASLSPSFSSYSNTNLTAIAARIVNSNESIDEQSDSIDDEFCFRTDENSHTNRIQQSDDEDADLEFAFVTKCSDLPSPISPVQNGRIRPVYPVLNRDSLHKHANVHKNDEATPRIRLPLRRLFIEERESAITTSSSSSSSSSEADELDGVPAETYCVWRPNKAEDEVKSSSKRWRLKDLLPRSHSDGSKDSFVFLSLGNTGRKKENEVRVDEKIVSGGENKKSPAPVNRSGGEKRRTYLPYRQDLLGLFGTNVNGLSKNL